VKVALVQYSQVWQAKEKNREKILQRLNSGMLNDVSAIIFPELTLTGYTMYSKKFAEKLDDQSVTFFCEIAKRFNVHVFAGFIEYSEDNYYNSLVHVNSNGNIEAKYRKIHPFSFTGENKFYAAGKTPVITQIGDLKIGVSVCYDLRFPELFRYYGKERVHLIINIANWPEQRINHWRLLLQARAIENQCYVIGVNRVGKDKTNSYNGGSSVFHPFGKELLCLDDKEQNASVEILPEEVQKIQKKYPFLNDISLI
jgi:predicted amidohydrolase